MSMTAWHGYEAREDFGNGAIDVERWITELDAADANDFESGAP